MGWRIKNCINFNQFLFGFFWTISKDDFVIFDINGNVVATIEFNGEQHYEPIDFTGRGESVANESFRKIQERDKIKSDYLKSHNIPQLIIPYWEFDNIEKLVSEFIAELSKAHNLWESE